MVDKARGLPNAADVRRPQPPARDSRTLRVIYGRVRATSRLPLAPRPATLPVVENRPLADLLAALASVDSAWLRAALTRAAVGRQLALLEITAGEPPPSWQEVVWRYENASFAAAEVAGADVAGWLSEQRLQLASLSVGPRRPADASPGRAAREQLLPASSSRCHGRASSPAFDAGQTVLDLIVVSSSLAAARERAPRRGAAGFARQDRRDGADRTAAARARPPRRSPATLAGDPDQAGARARANRRR
jgi:hypothetical protein